MEALKRRRGRADHFTDRLTKIFRCRHVEEGRDAKLSEG